MDNQTKQRVAESKVENKQMKKIKSVTMPAVLFLTVLLMAFVIGCGGGGTNDVQDAFSSSNDAVETGIDDGTDAVETGAQDGADAINTGVDDGTDGIASGSNAISTGVEDGADAVNDGVDDGTDAVSDAADDVADEFQNVTTIVSVTVTPSTASVKIGGTQQYSATATYQNGSSLSVSASAVWTSSTTSTATINEANRTATGVAVGTTEIKASFLGKSGISILTVTAN